MLSTIDSHVELSELLDRQLNMLGYVMLKVCRRLCIESKVVLPLSLLVNEYQAEIGEDAVNGADENEHPIVDIC